MTRTVGLARFARHGEVLSSGLSMLCGETELKPLCPFAWARLYIRLVVCDCAAGDVSTSQSQAILTFEVASARRCRSDRRSGVQLPD